MEMSIIGIIKSVIMRYLMYLVKHVAFRMSVLFVLKFRLNSVLASANSGR